MPDIFKTWPDRGDSLTPQEVIDLYADGFAGARFDPAEYAAWQSEVLEGGGVIHAEDAAYGAGWAGSHAGKLVAPWVHVEKAYPGCWPGPAQGRGDCVSHSGKNARLLSLVCEVVAGLPDEVSGKVESLPAVSPEGIKNGVLSTESAYWYRGHGGDGWQCASDARVAMKQAGCVVRQNYSDIGVDLTRYSSSVAGKWGRSEPPDNVRDATDNNLIRTSTEAESFDEIRDLLGNGYGISSCGSEGFSSSRDDNGVSSRKGSWSHAMAYIGADDRPEIHSKYGEPLVLVLNSWGRWNSGPRRVLGSSLDIPEGSFWARWSDLKRRSAYAFSSVNGWPGRSLPDLSPGAR